MPKYFLRAVDELRAGQLEDAARIVGVATHYIEDSAAFGHLQGVHRGLHWDTRKPLQSPDYTPQNLGGTPEAAAQKLVERMKEMVEATGKAVDPVFAKADIPLTEVKRLT